ncbi:tol-pal system-associated acyl-CoA thioesterase [Arenicella xantha]|uniref:Acyl-CoA thioester hydrolase n=1 Tax=Arenicella xantha TaxID=644221 RepID=A0A395JPF1_9GAMM|nr:tol-pal system-associated acyl-CoA thioesterase [Arenicella xantha]RBP53223.1 acyl-CoA thioester hydrolase [Arenicella xantha]
MLESAESELASFEFRQRVYYEDTDAGGVVYHSKYLNFMERCRCEWLNSLGFDVADLQNNDGIMFVVRHAELSFDKPAKLFDELIITAAVLHVGKVKLELQQKIYNQSQLLCKATIKLATLDSASFKLTAMPDPLRIALSL